MLIGPSLLVLVQSELKGCQHCPLGYVHLMFIYLFFLKHFNATNYPVQHTTVASENNQVVACQPSIVRPDLGDTFVGKDQDHVATTSTVCIST